MNTTRTCLAALAAAIWLPSGAKAAVLISGTVRPLGGAYQYAISIENTGPEDLALVTLVDAPLADPLMGPSLTAPAGFMASYDGGLGVLDFLGAVTDFLAGTQTGPFRFESLAGPGSAFASFESLDVTGQPTRGPVSLTVIPEPAMVGTALAWGLLGGALFWRRRCP